MRRLQKQKTVLNAEFKVFFIRGVAMANERLEKMWSCDDVVECRSGVASEMN
jgi:hypothetical protein